MLWMLLWGCASEEIEPPVDGASFREELWGTAVADEWLPVARRPHHYRYDDIVQLPPDTLAARLLVVWEAQTACTADVQVHATTTSAHTWWSGRRLLVEHTLEDVHAPLVLETSLTGACPGAHPVGLAILVRREAHR